MIGSHPKFNSPTTRVYPKVPFYDSKSPSPKNYETKTSTLSLTPSPSPSFSPSSPSLSFSNILELNLTRAVKLCLEHIIWKRVDSKNPRFNEFYNLTLTVYIDEKNKNTEHYKRTIDLVRLYEISSSVGWFDKRCHFPGCGSNIKKLTKHYNITK